MKFKAFPSMPEMAGEEREAPIWERNSFVDARLREFDIERLGLHPNAGVEAVLEADRIWWDINLKDKTDEEKDRFIREHRRAVRSEEESAEMEFENLLSIRDELVRRGDMKLDVTAEEVLKELRVRNIIKDFLTNQKAHGEFWAKKSERDKKKYLATLGLSFEVADEDVLNKVQEEIDRRRKAGVDIERIATSIL